MQGLAPSEIFLFEDFRLDRRGGGLYRCNGDTKFEPVAIGSRGLDILGVLIERAGEVVSKDEIIAAVWPATVVEDSNLTVQLSALRRILDRGRPNGSCIQTVAGRGYRFVASVRRTDANADAPASLQTDARPHSLLSIVVLPFANLSNDPEQQYFADGITDDVTTDLSRIADSLVISRNTAFTYRNRLIDTKEIGRELRVRYVLEGSVRRSGNQIRVNAQLIDAETDAHLWAERFNGDTSDLFSLQDEITSRIAIALNYALVGAEAARPTADPVALDYIFRARAALSKPPSRESRMEVIGLFERALALDPGSVEAKLRLARTLVGSVLMELSNTRAIDLARAKDLLGQVSPDSPLAHYEKGQLLRAHRRWQEAIPEYEAAIALDRNSLGAYAGLGRCKLQTGSLEEVFPLFEQTIRLSPRDPDLGFWYDSIGLTHLLQSRTHEAIVWLEKARTASPGLPFVRGHLAAAYGIKGESERAAVELAEAGRLSRVPDQYSSISRLKSVGDFGVPKIRALWDATFFAGLRKAGMPEE
jgi:TolB-like protein